MKCRMSAILAYIQPSGRIFPQKKPSAFSGAEGVDHRDFVFQALYPEVAVGAFYGFGKAVERRVVVFVEELQLQALAEQAIEHLTEAVVPAVVGVGNIGTSVGVGAALFGGDHAVVVVGVLDELHVVVKHPDDRMKFGEVKTAAFFQKMGNDLSPALQVGQPADSAERGVHDVEFAAQVLGQVVEVAAHEAGLQFGFTGQLAGVVDGIVGNIAAGNGSAEAGQREGILAEMALEMQDFFAGHGAQFAAFDLGEAVATLFPGFYVIELGLFVGFGAQVPDAPVGFDVVVVCHVWGSKNYP